MPKDPVKILGDSYLVQVVFRNLLENAAKHGQREPLSVHVTTQAENDMVHIAVQDNGKGTALDTKALGRSFVTGKDGKGSGVGLYLVNSLVKSMAGAIDFSNDKGFTARIALRKAI